MRIVFAAALMLSGLVGPTFAASVFATPKALLQFAYQSYFTGSFPDNGLDDGENPVLYSKGLNAEIKAAAAGLDNDDIGPVDFDVFVNGQDYQLSDLVIGDPSAEGAGERVPVSFSNFDKAESLVFHMVREDGGWKIDDIESLGADDSWRFSKLLSAPGIDSAGTDVNTGTSGDRQ